MGTVVYTSAYQLSDTGSQTEGCRAVESVTWESLEPPSPGTVCVEGRVKLPVLRP